MTKLTDRKTTVRAETSTEYRGRPLCVELEPRSITIWRKGLRRGVTVPWDAIYDLGQKLAARHVRE